MATGSKATKLQKSDYERYLQKGIGYNQYKQQMAEDLAENTDFEIKEYIHLNQRRMYRVEKTFEIPAELEAQIKNLKHKIYWLILTEHWCGDASQTLPVFNAIAEMSSGKIEMKMVYREQNPELMDAYLTNETRSIPKLIQLDEHFNVTAFWGPRPSAAQQLVQQLKSNPVTAAAYANELHLWYAKNKQESLKSEIVKLLYRASLFCPDCLS